MTDTEKDELIRVMACNIWHLTLCGTHVGAHDWCRDIHVGDLVVETSTSYLPRPWPAVGRLLRITREPFPVGEDWPKDEPIPNEKVFYIESLSGVETRWTNADFVRVPESIDPWRKP